MYKKYNNPSTQGTLGTWSKNNGCCEQPEYEENEDVVQSIEDVDSDNTIDISTTITISQTATSAGGAGGDGGDGGEGGGASQAYGLIAVAINEIEAGLELPTVPEALGLEDTVSSEQLQQLERSRPQQSEDGTTATGGDANGGTGGAGGNATSLNYASVVVDNVVIINSNVDGDGQYPAYTIGTGNRKLEIRLDENGETFVNGAKMDEQTLGDGTKVLIFRDSKVNNS
jgi:hypothetical protein